MNEIFFSYYFRVHRNSFVNIYKRNGSPGTVTHQKIMFKIYSTEDTYKLRCKKKERSKRINISGTWIITISLQCKKLLLYIVRWFFFSMLPRKLLHHVSVFQSKFQNFSSTFTSYSIFLTIGFIFSPFAPSECVNGEKMIWISVLIQIYKCILIGNRKWLIKRTL